MTDLGTQLERLGLEHYLDAFVGEGFDTWETVLDIQESDFDALNIKLGHRRKLQRAIAEYRNVPYERLYGSAAYDLSAEGAAAAGSKAYEHQQPLNVHAFSGPGPHPHSTIAAGETKRKYRRHPKPDENAPERPPSAYVIFSNKIREEIRDQNLSFTQIAKLVGDRWQKLDPNGKEPYESQANAAKERYNIQLSAYKKTDSYREYMHYLAEFKAKHGGGGQSEQKKPKLETGESSAGSVSGRSGDLLSEHLHSGHSHARGSSMSSMMPTGTSPASPGRGATHLLLQHPTGPGTALPARGPISVPTRSGSPPGTARDPRGWRPQSALVGQLSNQSSLSEGSSIVRSDSDPLQRTASLTLSTPPSGTPPLLLQGDSGSALDARRPRIPGPPPSLPSYGSSSYSQTLPSPATSDSSWRGRSSEVRGYLDISPGSMQPPTHQLVGAGSMAGHAPPPVGSGNSTSMSLPPLTASDRMPDLQYRTLPLPRTSPTQQPGYVGTSNTAAIRFSDSQNPFAAPPHPGMPPRAESSGKSPLDRSDSDNLAASTLAGLAAAGGTHGSGVGEPPSGYGGGAGVQRDIHERELHRWPPSR